MNVGDCLAWNFLCIIIFFLKFNAINSSYLIWKDNVYSLIPLNADLACHYGYWYALAMPVTNTLRRFVIKFLKR